MNRQPNHSFHQRDDTPDWWRVADGCWHAITCPIIRDANATCNCEPQPPSSYPPTWKPGEAAHPPRPVLVKKGTSTKCSGSAPKTTTPPADAGGVSIPVSAHRNRREGDGASTG